MKTNTMMRIASVLLVAVLLSTCAIAGTYAKYVSTYTGDDSARVAVWAFEMNDTEIQQDEFTFDLFNTIKDTSGSNEVDVDVNGTGTETVIAPGTQGSFELVLKNISEVTAKYRVTYSVENTNNIPIEYSLDGQTNWSKDVTSLNMNDYKTIAMNATADPITVYWRWAFTGNNDLDDTKLGEGGTATIKVTATVDVEQIDKTEQN